MDLEALKRFAFFRTRYQNLITLQGGQSDGIMNAPSGTCTTRLLDGGSIDDPDTQILSK
jgi:hypothetical protein